MLEIIQIEFKVEGFDMKTPLFKNEDSCLLYIEKNYPTAVELTTVTMIVYDCYRYFQHENQ